MIPNDPTAPMTQNWQVRPMSQDDSRRSLPERITVHLAESRSRLVGRVFTWFISLAVLVALFRSSMTGTTYHDPQYGVRERHVSGSLDGADRIAVITVGGVILDGDGFVKAQIDRVREDPSVRGIVVRVDSPGGSVTASDYIYHHLRKLREEKDVPLVVSMGGMAASGGYYVAMAVGDQPDSIFAEPTTTTGSIGVLIPHYDFSGLLERFDVKDDSIASHPRKLLLSMSRPMPDDQRALLEKHVGELFERFKRIVHSGRPAFRNAENRLERGGVDLATGEIFTADEALRHGLVDRIGFIEDAVDRVLELAQLDKSATRVVRYDRSATLWSSMVGDWMTADRPPTGLASILDAGVPRAYYLFTTLPPTFARLSEP